MPGCDGDDSKIFDYNIELTCLITITGAGGDDGVVVNLQHRSITLTIYFSNKTTLKLITHPTRQS